MEDSARKKDEKKYLNGVGENLRRNWFLVVAGASTFVSFLRANSGQVTRGVCTVCTVCASSLFSPAASYQAMTNELELSRIPGELRRRGWNSFILYIYELIQLTISFTHRSSSHT